MKTIRNNLLELFFPQLCVCCNNRLSTSENYICLKCINSLPKTDHLRYENNKLEEFFSGRFPFERIASFAYFVKGGSIQKIIHEFKYKDSPQLASLIGCFCGKEIAKHNAFSDIDLIVPVPLHTNRLKKRKYNQSLLIAESISAEMGKPVDSVNLIRKIDNPSQTKNSRFERWKNTDGIFGIKDESAFQNKHILLIDDVVTTGSTLEVCAKLILGCGGSKISIYTVGSAF